jgi:metal-sulfur cluster biosynthetic enzyme
MATIEQVKQALRTVVDPEIHLNIMDLGLVYGVEIIEEKTVKVDMTLTSPMCPYGPQIIAEVPKAIKEKLPEIEKTDVNLVWIPNWDPKTMATEDVKMELGIFDDLDEDDDE